MPPPCFRHSRLSCLALVHQSAGQVPVPTRVPMPAHASRRVLGSQTASHLSVTTPCGLFTTCSPKRPGGQQGGHGPHDLGLGDQIYLGCSPDEKSLF